MTDQQLNMPEKLIIESQVNDEEDKPKLDNDELSLSQELLEESQVQNTNIGQMNPEDTNEKPLPGSNTSVKLNENIKMQR